MLSAAHPHSKARIATRLRSTAAGRSFRQSRTPRPTNATTRKTGVGPRAAKKVRLGVIAAASTNNQPIAVILAGTVSCRPAVAVQIRNGERPQIFVNRQAPKHQPTFPRWHPISWEMYHCPRVKGTVFRASKKNHDRSRVSSGAGRRHRVSVTVRILHKPRGWEISPWASSLLSKRREGSPCRITQRRRSHPQSDWPFCVGNGGRIKSETVAGLNWNHWPFCVGMRMAMAIYRQ